MPVHSVEHSSTEIHYQVQELSQELNQALNFEHKISSTTAKIIQLNPQLVLGESNLFHFDSIRQSIILSPTFEAFLKLLVRLDELDLKALKAASLYDLNAILQQSQGLRGGLLRKEGIDRWHLEDNSTKQKYRQDFELLLQHLGFVSPKSFDSQMTVDHCIIFGARAERMEKRIIETLNHLKNNIKLTGHIFLLGSNRKLIPEEIKGLQMKLETLEEPQKNYWSQVFNDPEQSTEANAFIFLWKCIVPLEVQVSLEDKLISIKSTRIGNSYREQCGHRVTTEVTVEDWSSFYKEGEPQVIFALAEQPYIRLMDQLRVTVLSKSKTLSKEDLINRIKNTTFCFAAPIVDPPPLMSVVFDEIARNVYRITDTLKYLEGFSATAHNRD